MKPLRLLFGLLWLAFAIAMGQQAALLHGLAHAVEDVQDGAGSKLPAQSACPDCGLAAQLTGLPGTSPPALPVQIAGIIAALFFAAGIAARAPVVFRSRGPPLPH